MPPGRPLRQAKLVLMLMLWLMWVLVLVRELLLLALFYLAHWHL